MKSVRIKTEISKFGTCVQLLIRLNETRPLDTFRGRTFPQTVSWSEERTTTRDTDSVPRVLMYRWKTPELKPDPKNKGQSFGPKDQRRLTGGSRLGERPGSEE